MNQKPLIIGGIIVLAISLFFLVPKNKKSLAPSSEISSPSSAAAKELYQKAARFQKTGQALKAKETYQELLMNYPDGQDVGTIQKELEALNMNILFSTIPVPDRTVMHEIVTGDTLGKIAQKYGTTVDLVKKSNNLRSDVIRVGQQMRIWTGKFNIFVDKSQNVLVLKTGNEVLKVYNVSTGENNSTPVGTFKVVTKLIDPVWFNRGVIVPPESPQNVLGTRWLGFDLPGYGIHGTINTESIGRQVTAGCVRMRNEDIEELYSIVPMGAEVVVAD